MTQQRQIDAIVQRADHYETDADHELRQRAAVRVPDLWDRNVAVDGGTVAGTGGDSSSEPVYTRHIEPLEQGGNAYVRRRDYERELLVDLGGRDRLPHAPGCPNARVSCDEFRSWFLAARPGETRA